MVSSTSSINNISNLKVENRGTLYYGKYQYRARLKLQGLNRTGNSSTMLDVLKILKKYARPNELKEIDLDSLERYINWRNKHVTVVSHADKKATIRIEGHTAGIFSNDLQLLQTLESITGADAVDYTEIDTTFPTGIKYFAKEPKYKYRVYLKSRRVEEKFIDSLRRFILRYKDTQTVIAPSNSLNKWLYGKVRSWLYRYCSSHYYIEYNDDSTHSLVSLMFGDMIKCRYKLEKRPD